MSALVPTREQAPQIVRAAPPARSAAPATSSTGGLTGRDLLRILRKRKWMIILSVVICLVLTGLGTGLWQVYSPLYTAEALLQVTPEETSELDPRGMIYGNPNIHELIVQNAVRLASRREVLSEAAKNNLELRQTSYFDKHRDEVVDQLEEDVQFVPEPTADIIRVKMTGTNPHECATIVNAISQEAQEDSARRTTGQHGDDIDKLSAQLEKEEARLAQLEEAEVELPALAVADSAKLTELERQHAMLSYRLRDVMDELSAAAAEYQDLQAGAASAQESLDTFAEDPEVKYMIESDPIVRSLRSSEMAYVSQLEDARRKFGPNHQTVESLASRLESVRRQLEERVREVAVFMRQQRLGAPASARERLAQLQNEKSQVETELRQIEAELAEEQQRLEQQRVKNEAIREQIQAQRATHDLEERAVRERINRIRNRLLELELLSQDEPPLRVVSTAEKPRTPSWPKWSVMIALGIVLGLVVGVGLAVLLEVIDTSIKNPADVSRRVDLPLLGMIPHSEDLEDVIEDMRLACLQSCDSLVDESLRQIRTGLLFSGPASERRSLLVTSPLPGDGRSTVALNLGVSIARSGRKVLVVDANFRQPCATELFPECGEEGLSSALVGRTTWQDCVHQVEENLHVLPTGPLPPNPAELLGSDQMTTMVAEMHEQYDQVLFDAAPCVVVTDSQVLATQVDGAILVVRAGSNTHGVVQRTRGMLERVGAHIVGAVLNGVRVTAGGYLRKNYETYYEYHQRARLPAEAEVEQTEA